ncbi:MAG: PSD1 and planctomycete cytochrome C domain-containing protein [Gemmataceae bacterium]
MLQATTAFASLGILFLTAPVGFGGEKAATPEHIRFFETSIRPVLAEHCYRCHGPSKQRAGLRLDSRAAILKGSSGGAVVDQSRPEKSLLLKAIRHEDPELKMPPEKKLSDRQIADLTRWVDLGLPYPLERVVGSKDGKDKTHWAFQPPVDPKVPAVKDATWPRSPLDNFILARLEEKGLRPAPPAERRTLIRRVTFDLTGLPPTPEEVDAFLKDAAPDAFAKVVDRLLASPHYGERWGRHWLDVARYSDSNGLDENIAYGNAWRYRDYVVAAFNQDKPYDQFLLEQLAGDLLSATDPEARSRQLIATGFLALGPKVLAEVDEKKMELDIVDEQIDTFGRAILGMTFGCARCHDHKFDPITAKDYYGLAGIFQSTKTMEHFRKIARWHENPIADPGYAERKAAHDRRLAEAKEAITQFTRKADDAVKAKGVAAAKNLEPHYPAETKTELKRLRDDLAKLTKAGPEMSSAMGVTEAKVMETPLYVRGNHLKPGAIVPRQAPLALTALHKPKFDSTHSGRLELARWLVRPNHPLTARVMVNRVWRWHFGAGIVATPDNFGLLAAAPSHPELLDWLAQRFVESKWSIKAAPDDRAVEHISAEFHPGG